MKNIQPATPKKTKSRNSIKRFGSDAPYKTNMISDTIPDHFGFLANRLVEKKLLNTVPISVTVNEYLPGQGITAHIDSKTSGPIITILSLLSDATMIFQRRKEKHIIEIPARSIIQMRNEIRDLWTHAILPVKELRYSIVFRCAT